MKDLHAVSDQKIEQLGCKHGLRFCRISMRVNMFIFPSILNMPAKLRSEERFRSPNNLAELENVPAFKRRNVNLDDTPHSSESSVTRFDVRDTEETDENGNIRGGLSDGNEFLHQSVD